MINVSAGKARLHTRGQHTEKNVRPNIVGVPEAIFEQQAEEIERDADVGGHVENVVFNGNAPEQLLLEPSISNMRPAKTRAHRILRVSLNLLQVRAENSAPGSWDAGEGDHAVPDKHFTERVFRQ